MYTLLVPLFQLFKKRNMVMPDEGDDDIAGSDEVGENIVSSTTSLGVRNRFFYSAVKLCATSQNVHVTL